MLLKRVHRLTSGRWSSRGQLTDCLFHESGGTQISGDSGTGKSTLICTLAAELARRGHGFSVFDPHGDLVRKVKRICLSMGPRVARRVYEITPGDTSIVTAFNPLSVDRTGLDEFT